MSGISSFTGVHITRCEDNPENLRLMGHVDSLELLRTAGKKRSINRRFTLWAKSSWHTVVNKLKSRCANKVQFQCKCLLCGSIRHGGVHTHNLSSIDLSLLPWLSVDSGREWHPVGPVGQS